MELKSIIRKIKYGNRCSSEAYTRFLRSKGVKIGKGMIFYDPVSTIVDISNPELVSIGDNVRITHGCIILTHDYSWSVLCGVYGEVLGGVAPVSIGNNVFLGMNTIVLKGTSIGDNVIIGAGSIVTKDVPSNEVWAGNPARKIMSLEEYYIRKQISTINEFEDLVHRYGDSYEDHKNLFREFEPLFKDYNCDSVMKLLMDTGYLDQCKNFYSQYKRPYRDINHKINK